MMKCPSFVRRVTGNSYGIKCSQFFIHPIGMPLTQNGLGWSREYREEFIVKYCFKDFEECPFKRKGSVDDGK